MPTKIQIQSDYITLGQLLKLTGIVSTGGQAKFFLKEYMVKVNEEPEQRRGKKLYPGDLISIAGVGQFQIERED